MSPGSLTNHRDARGIDAPDSRIVDDAIHGLLAIVPLRWEGTGRAGAVANAGDGEATVGQPEDGTVSPRGICPVTARYPDDQGQPTGAAAAWQVEVEPLGGIALTVGQAPMFDPQSAMGWNGCLAIRRCVRFSMG